MTDLVDKAGWSKKTLEAYNRGAKGIDNSIMAEGKPIYNEVSSEIVNKGRNNTYIVLGRDRPAGKTSGYGGLGASHCGAISLVAGRMGQKAADIDNKGNVLYADPNHRTDAAFVYISQKTDVDINLNLADGKVGDAIAKSAIVLKADNLRFISRQGVKIVTGTDNKLSTDGPSEAVYGVDIIAGNNDNDLQPMVKGDNLVDCLTELKKEISKLNGALTGFINYQNDFNTATLNHYHITTWPLGPTSPTMVTPGDALSKVGPKILQRITTRTLRTLSNQKYNLNRLEATYLQRGHAKDGKTNYINSLYNNVN
jgi:hypothetical protein